jgi:hypothetical protein
MTVERYELVRDVEIRHVGGHVHPCADAEPVDRRTLGQESGDLVLVEITADEDPRVGEAGIVK